jgi:hypothetical protein
MVEVWGGLIALSLGVEHSRRSRSGRLPASMRLLGLCKDVLASRDMELCRGRGIVGPHVRLVSRETPERPMSNCDDGPGRSRALDELAPGSPCHTRILVCGIAGPPK